MNSISTYQYDFIFYDVEFILYVFLLYIVSWYLIGVHLIVCFFEKAKHRVHIYIIMYSNI